MERFKRKERLEDAHLDLIRYLQILEGIQDIIFKRVAYPSSPWLRIHMLKNDVSDSDYLNGLVRSAIRIEGSSLSEFNSRQLLDLVNATDFMNNADMLMQNTLKSKHPDLNMDIKKFLLDHYDCALRIRMHALVLYYDIEDKQKKYSQ